MISQRILVQSSMRSMAKHCYNSSRSMNAGTSSYEGDGKTNVSILNKELDSGIMINAFSQMGFRLNNGMMVVGPMVIFPR